MSDENSVSKLSSGSPLSPAKDGGFPDIAVGVSNTPVSCPSSVVGFNVCFDYLKCSFPMVFDRYDRFFDEFLHALRLDGLIPDEEHGKGGYDKCFIYDESVVIMSGGSFTKNVEGKPTFLLELKGSSCRDFELRGGNWAELLDVCIKLSGKFTRVDIAVDDFSGLLGVRDIKKLVDERSFVSTLRKNQREGTLLSELRDGEFTTIESGNDGYTVTFGSRESKQLCIYNKRAERMKQDFSVKNKSWMRFESRFYHETADTVVKTMVLDRLSKDTLPQFAAGILGGLVEFKDLNGEKRVRRRPIDPRWAEFLKGVSAIKVQNQAKIESTMVQKHLWFSTDAGPTLMKAFLCRPDEHLNLIGSICFKAAQKLTNKDVASINNMRRQYGLNILTYEECVNILQDAFGKYGDPSPYVSAVLGFKSSRFDENGEVKEGV